MTVITLGQSSANSTCMLGKSFLLACMLTFTTIFSIAQAPATMSYQAVIRDATDALLVNQTVGVQISIIQTSPVGPVVFAETHNPTTNANGLITLEIGTGTPVTGSISAINWYTGPYFVQTETDPTGGTTYSLTTTSQLMSVPFALHANNGVPTGSIVPFGGTVAPAGWEICDGTQLDRVAYANLFDIIGIDYGAGDGSTTFHLPDLRGRFIRGADNFSGNDPDAASRVELNPGGNSGDNIGSLQLDAFQGHYHNISRTGSNTQMHADGGPNEEDVEGSGSDDDQEYTIADIAAQMTATTPETMGSFGSPRYTSETRPVNVAVNYIIKL